MKKIEGLIAATFGAFNEDGSLNLILIPAIVEKMIEDVLQQLVIDLADELILYGQQVG